MEWYLNPGAPVAPLRHEIRRYFSPYVKDEALYCIEIVVGELLSNVAKHTDSGATVIVDWLEDTPMLTVVDAGDGYETNEIKTPVFDGDGGMGLWLVQQLADDVRVTRGPRGGTTVTLLLRTAI